MQCVKASRFSRSSYILYVNTASRSIYHLFHSSKSIGLSSCTSMVTDNLPGIFRCCFCCSCRSRCCRSLFSRPLTAQGKTIQAAAWRRARRWYPSPCLLFGVAWVCHRFGSKQTNNVYNFVRHTESCQFSCTVSVCIVSCLLGSGESLESKRSRRERVTRSSSRAKNTVHLRSSSSSRCTPASVWEALAAHQSRALPTSSTLGAGPLSDTP